MEFTIEQKESITINGGYECEVALKTGGKEKIKIRQLSLNLMPKMAATLQDESALIELYCYKDKGWSETVTVESASEIADLGLTINSPFFLAWSKRQATLSELVNPGSTARIKTQLETAIRNISLSAGSPLPAAASSDSTRG